MKNPKILLFSRKEMANKFKRKPDVLQIQSPTPNNLEQLFTELLDIDLFLCAKNTQERKKETQFVKDQD